MKPGKESHEASHRGLATPGLHEHQKRRQIIGVDLYVRYMLILYFPFYLEGRGHSSYVPYLHPCL